MESKLKEHAEQMQRDGLEYTAEFVPFSKSRNAKKVTKPGDLSLNWFVTVRKGSQTIRTDYMQGIGHLPGYTHHQRWTTDAFEALKCACESGKTGVNRWGSTLNTKPIPAPSLADVLHSLALDASAIDSPCFEDWAAEFGYDTDSREGERIYRACVEIGLKLRAMLGEKGLQELRDAAQDY